MKANSLLNRCLLIIGFLSLFMILAGCFFSFFASNVTWPHVGLAILIAIALDFACGVFLLDSYPAIARTFIAVAVIFFALGLLMPMLKPPAVK